MQDGAMWCKYEEEERNRRNEVKGNKVEQKEPRKKGTNIKLNKAKTTVKFNLSE